MRQTLKSIQNERSYAQKEFNGWESMAGRPAHSDFISQIDKDIFLCNFLHSAPILEGDTLFFRKFDEESNYGHFEHIALISDFDFFSRDDLR